MTTARPPNQTPEPPPHVTPQRRQPSPWRGALVAASVALVLVLAFAIAMTVWVARPLAGRQGGPPAIGIEPADVLPGAEAPAIAAQPQPQGGAGRDPVLRWADRIAAAIDMPARALRAYALADVAMRGEAPGCRLSWATLAGIGRIETDHGRFAGARLGPDGRPSRPIVGRRLDGSPGVRDIPDTDGGRLDGDSSHDRAVGPMQFLPATWARWASDGDGDQVADPHDLDDAALAAGRYLCRGGRDTATPGGWWAAVLSYNNSVEYGRRVFGVADAYARATRPS
jgi:membrane-bound lytic murein transglycosylase B